MNNLSHPNKSKPAAPAPASTPASLTRSKSTLAGAPAPVHVATNERAPVPAPALINVFRPQGPRQGVSRGSRSTGFVGCQEMNSCRTILNISGVKRNINATIGFIVTFYKSFHTGFLYKKKVRFDC